MFKLTKEETREIGKVPRLVRTYTNDKTETTLTTYLLITDSGGGKWWAFEDLFSLPFIRQLAANKVVQLYGYGLAPDDIKGIARELKDMLRGSDPEKYEKAYAKVLELETLTNTMADPVKQCIGLCTVYLLFNDERPDSYQQSEQSIKMNHLALDIDLQSFFFELVDRHHAGLWQGIKRAFGNCFDDRPVVGEVTYQGARQHIEKIARHERKVQLLIRSMANGVVSERDRMLQYTVGELYQELSLFLEEMALRQKELEKLTAKTK